jgi:hypothetical protein
MILAMNKRKFCRKSTKMLSSAPTFAMLYVKRKMRNDQFDPKKRKRICIIGMLQQQQHKYAALLHINTAPCHHCVGISISGAVE